MRIKLASWYGDKAPGEEIDVDEVTLKALSRDGLVAEVVAEPATPEPTPAREAAVGEEPAVQPETGRKKR
ncbi:hypothetical protein [Streptomyces sp. NPDC047990]|uniref:hypothetical protein n=1 Tax=Streptomyces sp. NPDC047990 TaxID=3365496 RepID=UPI003712DD23